MSSFHQALLKARKNTKEKARAPEGNKEELGSWRGTRTCKTPGYKFNGDIHNVSLQLKGELSSQTLT